MDIIQYDPSRFFAKTFDRLTDELLNQTEDSLGRGMRVFTPRVDIREEGNQLKVTAEVPGVDKDHLIVEVHNGVLSISGEKKEEHTEKGKGMYRSERVYGSFKRAFTLPEDVDSEQISADFTNGVLTLVLPKRPEVAPKKVEIKSAKN
ncbi:MAG: Hsp20/alpha crystallin family protein [Deltaproteobacteria bacterium]|nr:Hsp20/alpha crystallin family protein [Deltaproteobacteria bacterium]